MIEDRESSWVIYPEYFDIRFSKRLGRKVPLPYCIDNPSLDEIIEATRKAGFKIVKIEREKKHPANWIENKGRIIILKQNNKSKRETLLLISKHLKIVRKRNIEKKKLEERKKKRRSGIDKYLERVLKEKKKK